MSSKYQASEPIHYGQYDCMLSVVGVYALLTGGN